MNRIKEIRLVNNMKQADLADKLNVTQATVSGWESGRRTPDLETVRRIAELFDCSIDELLGNEKAPTVEQNGERSMLDITALSPENRDRLEDYLHLLLDSQNK
nr:MAG TPA: Repressor protein CI [Caudoviricetes sp.]